MSSAQTDCGEVRELIPDVAAERLASHDGTLLVREHVAGCAECAAELELARELFRSRRAAPFGLVARVRRAVAQDRAPARTWWGITAAAIAALALGIGMTSRPTADVPSDLPGYAYEVDEADVWVSDDGLVAGAPLFDGLSDDDLLQLLDELAVGAAGGSA